jgi:biopolymer transport protein ExbD
MARKLRKKPSVMESDTLEITPLIDCVFLLLIFFMVTTVFKDPQQLKLTLPIAANPQELEKRQIVAELDEDGNVAIDSQMVSMDTVDAYLVSAKQDKGIATLLIKADKQTKHGDVIKLMMMARSVQIESIAMAVDTEQQDE